MTNDEIRMTKQKKPRMDIRGYVFVSPLVIEVFKVFEKLHRDTGFQPVLAKCESVSVDFEQFQRPTHALEARVTMTRLHMRSFSKDSIGISSVFRYSTFRYSLLAMLVFAGIARAGSITLQLPADIVVDKASATTEKLPKTTLTGTIDNQTITFADPIPGSAYEAKLTLKNAAILQGVDMGWYSRVPDKPNAEDLNDDDRQQMKAVFTAGAQFFNVQEATIIKGNHNRAVMLVTEERTNAFHSDSGDEIIWSPQLWYFQNNHGGWEKVMQTDRILQRVRFPTRAAYHAVVDKLKWVPELGGLKVTPKSPDLNVTLPPSAGVAATPPPSSQPSVVPQP